MNDDKFSTLLAVAIVPQIIDLIIKNDNLPDIEAIKEFYKSKTYSFLKVENTKVWHYKPLDLIKYVEIREGTRIYRLD